jgi:aryl-phospho-beta-D-glucosidase BglC (GH1 family)
MGNLAAGRWGKFAFNSRLQEAHVKSKLAALGIIGTGFAALTLGFAAPVAAADMSPLTVSDNHVVRNGAPFNFYGVNRDSLEWGATNWYGCGGDGHFSDADFAHIAAWDATAVRIPLSQADWLGRRCWFNYAGMVDAAVKAANAHGMYAILDLHWTDVQGEAPCDWSCGSGEQRMPDADSVTFWKQVAARYAGDPGVIFELFNEPHYVSWPCWRSGGCQVPADADGSGDGASTHPTYTAVGMQTLYDAIRLTGAQNLVLVSGLDWAYDLSGVDSGYALNGTNIVYATHVYTAWHNTVADWDRHFGAVAQHHPVAVTEFGSTDCSTPRTQALLQYLYAPDGVAADRISWTMWGWNSPGDCSQPSIISDWNGTPMHGQGQLIHDALANLAGGLQPAAESQSPAWYEIVNQRTGKCVDASSWGTATGTAVQQWTCGNGQANQEWAFVPVGSGYMGIVNRNASASGEVLDVAHGATNDGAQIRISAATGANEQEWQPVTLSNGDYEFVNRNSGNCLDVADGSGDDGARLQQWGCSRGPNQAFKLVQQP